MANGRQTLYRSLSARLLVPLLLTVVATFTVYAVVSIRSTRERFAELVQDSSERCSSLILGATHDEMLLNRREQLQETVERLGSGPGVEAIRIYDTRGRVALSALQEEVGRTVSMAEQPCRACHGAPGRPPLRASPARVGAPGGARPAVLRHLAAIPNEASCAATGCHPSPADQAVLGVLDLEMSLERLEEMLQQGARQMVWTVVSLLLVTGAITVGFVHFVIHRPVTSLRSGTERIARGELDTRIEVPGEHELAELAAAFNRMAEDLREAQREIRRWSQELEDKVVAKADELRRAQRQVLQMEKMASLGKLSATVAHELNNPIASILTYAKLVERELRGEEEGRGDIDPALRDELLEYLHLMADECSRCGDIVKNLLLFARRSGGELAPVDVNEVLERSLKLVRHHLEIADVRLHVERLEGDPVLHADVGQLEQALVALLVNAVEAMSGPGSEGGDLAVRLRGDGESVRIHVSDTGVGIHADILPHIFEPFFSTKHEESGVGLGLAVVYGIVRRHGGSIDVESEPGRGTTFHVTLPRRPDGGDGGGARGGDRAPEPATEAP